jgi:hypothetical protein
VGLDILEDSLHHFNSVDLIEIGGLPIESGAIRGTKQSDPKRVPLSSGDHHGRFSFAQ